MTANCLAAAGKQHLPRLSKRSDIKFKGPTVPTLMVQVPISFRKVAIVHCAALVTSSGLTLAVESF
jgi:hypothetical protein